MKAIIKVNKNSSFAKHNYLTFDVKEVLSKNLIALNINGVTTDFSVKEVIVVDFAKEINSRLNKDVTIELMFLWNYQHINKIAYQFEAQIN
jgi:hypothetical protein